MGTLVPHMSQVCLRYKEAPGRSPSERAEDCTPAELTPARPRRYSHSLPPLLHSLFCLMFVGHFSTPGTVKLPPKKPWHSHPQAPCPCLSPPAECPCGEARVPPITRSPDPSPGSTHIRGTASLLASVGCRQLDVTDLPLDRNPKDAGWAGSLP